MNRDFIRVKALEGELKISQIRRQFGCSVTTKEVIFLKPHHSYQIRLDDIISIIPHEIENTRQITFSPAHSIEQEKVVTSFNTKYYKLSAEKVKIYNQNGSVEKGPTDFIIPISDKILEYIAIYSNLVVFGR